MKLLGAGLRKAADAFARGIGVVPAPHVPALAIAAGGLALANIVALVPARAATRVPAGLALRAEEARASAPGA